MKNNIFTIAFILIFQSIYAQDLTNDVKVVAAYKPTISDAFKINFLPTFNDTATYKPDFEYSIESKQVKTDFVTEPIFPASMLGEPLTKLYRSTLKAGFGNYLTPMVDFTYSTLRSKKYMLGVKFGHLSSNSSKLKLTNTIKSAADYSDNYAKIYAKQFFDHSTLSGDLYFSRNKVTNYGFNVDADEADTLNTYPLEGYLWQRFIDLGANIRFYSTHADSSSLHYNTALNLDYFQDAFAINQKSLKFETEFEKFFENKLLGAEIEAEHFLRTNLMAETSNNSLVKIKPFGSIFGENWKIKGGVNICTAIEDGTPEYFVYPMIDLEFNIAENIVIPYAGFNGDIISNDFKKISNENPFTMYDLKVKDSNQKMNFYGGFRGSLSAKTNYNLRASYTQLENAYFFVNDSSHLSYFENQFDVVYDNVDLLNLYGEITYNPSKKLGFLLNGAYNKYLYQEFEEKAWHKPEYEVSFNTRYNLKDKIVIKSDIFVQGKRYAKSFESGTDFYTLKEIVDVNLGVEYRYTNILSAFINFNNLTSSKYQKWNFYPSQRFNVMVGFSYSM